LGDRENHDENIYEPSNLAGWWYTYPSENYESQLGLLFPKYGKIKNVSNHQPEHH
jgi:hypothetical protein